MPETLAQTREIIFSARSNPKSAPLLRAVGPEHVGKHILCLIRNSSGYYIPTLAFLLGVPKTAHGKYRVSMWLHPRPEGEMDDVRSLSEQAVYWAPHCADYDMTLEELRAAILSKVADPKGLLPLMNADRLRAAMRLGALPYYVRPDGTAHWPCHNHGLAIGDTESEAIEVKGIDAVEAALLAGHTLWYNHIDLDDTVRAGRVKVSKPDNPYFMIENKVNGTWIETERGGCFFYDSEEGQHG